MDLIKCEAFLTAADMGSLTAASEALGYTQSGVTRMIRSLEEELGFSLLTRSKKGVEATANGKIMIPILRELVRAHRNAEEVAAQINGMTSGSLTIGSYYSVSAIWMPTILSRFRERYPHVNVNMYEGGNKEMTKWLNERSVDCCFCAMPSSDTDCQWIPVIRDEIVAWLPKDHPNAQDPAFPIEKLESEPFIMTSPNHDTDQDRLLAEENLKPNVCFSTRDGFTTYNMVAAGLGISFNQRLISKKWNGDVAEIPFEPRKDVLLGIAVPSMKDASPATKKFIQCVKEVLAEISD